MTRTISILSDNRSADPKRFGCEHGLSVLVRTPFCILQSVMGPKLQTFACGTTCLLK